MTKSKGREGKGLAVLTALATALDPLANFTEGKEIELVKWENKWGLPEIWLEAPESKTHGQAVESPEWALEATVDDDCWDVLYLIYSS